VQSQGDAMSKTVRGVLVVVAVVVDLVSCSRGGGPTLTFAQPAPAGGAQPATGIYVRRGGGYVWVPLDASGSPQIPGAASQGPSAPPAPPAPGALPASLGLVGGFSGPMWRRVTRVSTSMAGGWDRRISSSDPISSWPAPQGLHRVEVRKSGFMPARVVVEIAASQTHLLHLQLAPHPTGSSAPSGSESDSLTADIPPGGGYFVVPAR
jgi:hypothetical protein